MVQCQNLLSLPPDLLRFILHTPDDEKRALCSLRTALLRGSLCKQLRLLLQQKGGHIPVAVGEHRMIPPLPSMPFVPRCFEIVALTVEELSRVSANLFNVAARAHQLQRLERLELQDCTLHYGRYRLLLEHLPALRDVGFLDVRTLADPDDVDELYLYGDWEQSPMPPLRRFTAFSMSRHMVMETPVELRVQWPASLAPLVGALECLGLTLSDADNTILCTENLFFGALKTLQLDVRHSTMTAERYAMLWDRVPVLEELAVQLSMPADAIGNTQSLCSSFRRPMPRLRDLRITSPLYCEMLVRVFGDSEHIAENMTAVQTLYLGGYTDGADTCERAKAILPAILARFASANTFTISDRRRRAGPLPLVVMQN